MISGEAGKGTKAFARLTGTQGRRQSQPAQTSASPNILGQTRKRATAFCTLPLQTRPDSLSISDRLVGPLNETPKGSAAGYIPTGRKTADRSAYCGPTEPKRGDMRTSHHLNPKLTSGCKRWFLDGKDGDGKTVTNPNTGYGACARKRAGRKTRPFYNNGDSASTTGVSVYIMGIADKM